MPQPLCRAVEAAARLDRVALVSARTHLHRAPAERWIGTYSRLGEHGGCWLSPGAAGALLDQPWEPQR